MTGRWLPLHCHPVIFATLAIAVTSAGCLGNAADVRATPQEVSEDSLGEDFEAWNFTGHSGNLTFGVENLTWLHVVVPVPANEARVEVSLYWDYGSREWREQDTTWYSMFTMWFTDGTGPDRQIPSHLTAYARGGHNWSRIAAYSEVAGEEAEIEQSHPIPHLGGVLSDEKGDSWVRMRTSLNLSRAIYQDAIGDVDRPVLNLLYVQRDPYPLTAPVEVEMEWKGTRLNFTYGLPVDFFEYRFQQQDSTAEAGASAGPEHVYAGYDMQFPVDLVSSDRAVFFAYLPAALVGADYPVLGTEPGIYSEAGFVRPDGSSVTNADPLERPFLHDVSSQTGTWTFHAEASLAYYPFSDRFLFGTEFDPAMAVWR